MKSKDVSSLIKGIAHIGIPVTDVEKSKAFYQDVLGMEILHENILKTDEEDIPLCFLKKGDMVLELYHVPSATTPKTDGAVDHIAFRVKDLETVKEALKEKGIEFIDDEIATCEYLFDNGSRWILFYGPDKEKIELNECF